LDEEKSKHGGLTQEISFDSAQVHTLRWLKKGAANACAPAENSVINMI
jgi:hypothetical protein